MTRLRMVVCAVAILVAISGLRMSRAAGLVLAQDGKTSAQIVVAADAGPNEKKAGADLQKYIEMMSGAKPELVATAAGNGPQILVGNAAFAFQPKLKDEVQKAAKPNPTLRSDAIVVRRVGNKILVVGNSDEASYYAASWLLQKWGCYWYLPGDIGEVIPDKPTLAVDELNTVYAPPFEIRSYWLAWNAVGDNGDFTLRNRMSSYYVPNGHHPGLADWTKELIPEGKSEFNVPLAEEKTMDHVAEKTGAMYAKGESFSLGMADGVYVSDSARDKELQANLTDKYMRAPMLTDNFLTLYNGVAERLQKKYPESKAHIGFLAYTNITIPPQRVQKAAKPLIAYLAPIDIDPIHSMDDLKSPSRGEYKAMMQRWAKVMDGRVVIYDYDQGMLVWRDLPNPSLQSFRTDVKHYRDAKILGVSTESRGALATTFTNIFWRAQLMWNPDADVDKMEAEFYPNFYGPAAAPMQTYWQTINSAWSNTLATEHEYFVAPAVYTPAVVAALKTAIAQAETAIAPLKAKANLSRNEKLYLDRMAFTRASFETLENYMAMTSAAATQADYKGAVAAGEKALASRLALANLNPMYTTRVVGVAPETEANGPAWFPGEVALFRTHRELTDGTKGDLVAKLPLDWAFHRDPRDSGLARGWAYAPVDLTFWNANKAKFTGEARKDYPTTEWETVSTDLYLQAQGIRHSDGQSYTGFGWYRSDVELKKDQVAGKVHLMFPGSFNESWLYINGNLVAHREFPEMWWNSDYKFMWDIDIADKLKAGTNTIALRINNPHHPGGMFRRPYLYRAK